MNETEALRELYTSLKLSVVDVSAEHDSCSCALMRTANDCLLVSASILASWSACLVGRKIQRSSKFAFLWCGGLTGPCVGVDFVRVMVTMF